MRKDISAHEFRNHTGRRIENVRVIEAVKIQQINFEMWELINNEIDQLILLECRSSGDLILKDCKIKELSIKSCSYRNLTIENCRIENLWLDELSIKAEINIVGEKGVVRNLRVDDCKFEEFRIRNIRTSEIDIVRPSGNNLWIANLGQGKMRRERKISFFQKDEDVKVNYIVLMDIAGFSIECSSSKVGRFYVDNVKGDLELHECTMNFIWIEKSFLRNFHLGEVKANVLLQESSFDEIEFFGNSKIDLQCSNGHGEDQKIRTLSFDRYIPQRDDKISFTNCEFNNVTFNRSTFTAFFQLNSVRIDQNLSVSASNLGKAHLGNVSLGSRASVSIIDSDVTDVAFNNFGWNKYQLGAGVESMKKNTEFLKTVRESYRQLKANYSRNGNKIESLEFQKYELLAHYYILKQSLGKINFHSLGNFLIVWSHKNASGFSLNVLRPFGLLFIFHLIFFNLMLFYTPELGTGVGWALDCEATKKGASLFFQTLLPTHFATVKSLDGNDVSIAGFWDFMMRVFSAYFIFYFISASRKYHQ